MYWSVDLSVPDGGLVETEDPYPYIAPKDGYKSSILFETKSSDAKWSRSLNYKRFYVRSRNGQFHAIIDLTLYVYNDGRVLVEINSLSNANGSTDLMPEFPNIKLPSAK